MNVVGTLRVLRMFARAIGRLPAGHLWYLLKRMQNEKPHRFGGQVRINTFFPPYPSAAFDRFLSAVIARKRVPFSTYLAVTGDCPFSCDHCSHGRRSGSMSVDQLRNMVEQIRTLGTCTLGFTGGEPLLCEHLEELVTTAGSGDAPMATIVFTTGAGLTAARAARLAEAELTCITIGIESDNATDHDRVRGVTGSFDAARQAVRVAQQAGLYTAVSTVGTRERMASGELDRMYALAHQWAAREFRLLAPVATGAAVADTSLMLTPDEKAALADFHVRHNRAPGVPVVACFAYLESAEMFGCGAGYHHVFIDASGEVCPCDLTPLSFGNATTEPLAGIWQRLGETFTAPRRACLMGELTEEIGNASQLPIPRELSEQLCAHCSQAHDVPEGYRRLLTAKR